MFSRELTEIDRYAYDEIVDHPLQSWEWGQFRRKLGTRVVRVGLFSVSRLKSACQLTLHRLPFTPYQIGYLPKGPLPDPDMLTALAQIGRKYNCIFIQLEPNVIKSSQFNLSAWLRTEVQSLKLIPSSRPLLTKYTFHLDLTKSADELFKNLQSKTRYNVRLAQKHGVTVQEENIAAAFATYLKLSQETTERQGFYAHNLTYHRLMWETLQPANIAHLLTARYREKILVTWILFLYKDILYYPYGASTAENKEVMASNLMLWEAMLCGKTHGAKLLDLWGTPGPDPQPTDPYYGFHKFKLGYGPKLVEFVGSYDLVLKPGLYKLFTLANKLRWALLKLKARI